MSEHEEQLLEDAVKLNGQSGIVTSYNEGVFESNYAPFIKFFKNIKWTTEHDVFVVKKWKEYEGDPD